jgi:hypothetical protein
MEKNVSTKNPMNGSTCKSCRFLIRRVIIPFNEAEYGIDRESLGIPEDQEIIYEHYMCNEVGVDLDHIVLECNRYKPRKENCLLGNDF